MQTNFFHALTESFLKSRQYLRKLFYGQTREIQELEFFSADLGISHGHRLSPSVAFSSVYHNRNKVYFQRLLSSSQRSLSLGKLHRPDPLTSSFLSFMRIVVALLLGATDGSSRNAKSACLGNTGRESH